MQFSIFKKNKEKLVAHPSPAFGSDKYKIPSLDILLPVPVQSKEQESFLMEQSSILETTLRNFKIEGTIENVSVGPLISRYELMLSPGVKVNKIVKLGDDLALALKTMSIRILAPIPGTNLIGIEVPNQNLQTVHIREILESAEFQNKELPIAVGKTTDGDCFVTDLTKAPHLLVAGQTGSGKSVGINSILTSFLISKSPDQLRLILIDPKMVELQPYNEIPHLLTPVITEAEPSIKALEWAIVQMELRYTMLSDLGARNIETYNEMAMIKIPYIVIIIDELSDLMLTSRKGIEGPIVRLAQKARAVGIHLILATQRPEVKVITGLIKANFPSRIAFKTSGQVDAKIILDKIGSEKLLGKGDMLYKGVENPDPIRLHGCLTRDADTMALIRACADQFVKYDRISF